MNEDKERIMSVKDAVDCIETLKVCEMALKRITGYLEGDYWYDFEHIRDNVSMLIDKIMTMDVIDD